MTDAEIVKALTAAAEAISEAKAAERRLLKELFPVNSYVRWRAGVYTKAGLVSGHNPYVSELVVVTEHTRETAKVNPIMVLSALKED